jgi:hypothetical protein
MKRLILLLSGIAMTSWMFAGIPVALTLHKTTKVVKPDGAISSNEPWTSTWIPMYAKKTSNTVDEMSAQFQMAYNDTYLWVLAQQKGNATLDTGAVAIPNSWERDDFEIFIAMDTTAYAHLGKYGEYNFQFRQQRSSHNNFPWAFDDSKSAATNNRASFRVGQIDAGDGSFTQEWQIPWKALTDCMTDSGKFDGSFIKFEIQAADNTTGAAGGRNDQTFWRDNSDNEYQDSRTFSIINLADQVNIQQPVTQKPALTLHKTTQVCTPDGVAKTDGSEPWSSTWIPMNAKKTANTVDEMSSQFQLAYNDMYLWVLAQQKGNSTMDTGVIEIPNSWDRDCFEVFVSMDTTSWGYGGRYGEANNQFRMERATKYPWGFDDSHYIGRDNASFKIGQVDAGDGSFVQEWQIPWKGLLAPMADSGNFDGQYIKFEIQSADNTTGAAGGRNDQIFWLNNSDNEYQDSRTHSLVMLADKVLPVSNALSFPPINGNNRVVYGSGPVTLNATHSGGLPITYTSSNSSIASINGNLLTIVGIGTVTITASSSANNTYPAYKLSQTLTVYKANVATPALILNKTSKNCIPDGIVTVGSEPWTSTWIPMTAKKTANTVDEMSAQFQLAYNDTYLWVLAQQKGNSTIDTGAVALPNSWERDDFEVFVAMDTTAYSHKGMYGDYNFQFRQQRSTDNNFPWAFDDSQSAATNNRETFRVGQIDAGDGSFVQEWQIPWKALTDCMTDSGKFDGRFIRFEIQAADNTTGAAGGRNDQIFWRNSSDNEYQDSRTLSIIQLAQPVGNSSSVYDDLKNARDSIRMLQSQLNQCQDGVVNVVVLDMQTVTAVVNFSGLDVQVKMYPNPATQEVTIECSSVIYKYEIYSIVGNLIGLNTVNANTANLQINGYQVGTYIMKIYTPDGVIRNKLIIKK